MLRLGDAVIMSGKKDGLVNIGGFLAMKEEGLFLKCLNILIITEGFQTYGGMAGRDMEAFAIGLKEVFDKDYLHYRIKSTAYLGEKLRNKGVEVITTDEGGLFQGDEKQKIDYVAQANTLFEQQSEQRQQIRTDISQQQSNIDKYRTQAQTTIDNANDEIKRLQISSTGDADDIINRTTEYQLQIDDLYDTISVYKEERFPFEQEILNFEREVGPIKYVAEVIYGQETARDYLDNAIRWVIFAIIFVFDPLAILLLITSIGLIAHPKTGTIKPKTVENRYVLQVPKDKILNMKKPK